MTRTRLGIGFALLIGLLGCVWFFGGARERGSAGPSAVDGPGRAQTTLVAPEVAPAVGLVPERSAAESTNSAEPAATEAPSPELCVLLGRVLDSRGAPVVGARVVLTAYKLWAADFDAPYVTEPKQHGFLSATDEDGRFRFAVPPPTASRQRLAIEPDRFVDSFTCYFGEGARSGEASLGPGVRDLGDLQLARTGAIAGRVLDDRGQPLADVELDTGPNLHETYSRGTRSGPDGHYELPHARVGTYMVKAKKDGWLETVREDVTVEAERITSGVDLILEPAPSIEGRVTDPLGVPISDAKVWGGIMGTSGSTRSGSDGRFVLYLRRDEPCTVEVTCDGFAPWGVDRERIFDPGTRDLEVVLEPMAPTSFRVVDDETGVALTHFGVSILESNGSKSLRNIRIERRRPASEARPDGVQVLTARAGIDLVLAAADGYELYTGDVEHGPNGEPEQTIRLKRAAGVRGRAWRDGEPVAHAAVTLTAVYSTNAGGHARTEIPAWRNSTQGTTHTNTDAEGRFEVVLVSNRSQRLSIEVGPGASLEQVPLQVKQGEVLDLGDLHAVSTARIDGQVLTPPEVSPRDLVVSLDNGDGQRETTVDEHGRFRFDEVAPGARVLSLTERAGELFAPPATAIEVVAGSDAVVTIDARDFGSRRVRLRVTGPGTEGLEHANVFPSWLDPSLAQRGSVALGQLDEHGRVEASLPGIGSVSFFIIKHDGPWIHFPDVEIDLALALEHDVELATALGALTVNLPTQLAATETTRYEVQLIDPAAPDLPERHHGQLNGASSLDLPHCTIGPRQLRVRLFEPSGRSSDAPALYAAQASVELRPGERATVTLD